MYKIALTLSIHLFCYRYLYETVYALYFQSYYKRDRFKFTCYQNILEDLFRFLFLFN